MARKRKSNLQKIMNTIRKGFQEGRMVGGKNPYYVEDFNKLPEEEKYNIGAELSRRGVNAVADKAIRS